MYKLYSSNNQVIVTDGSVLVVQINTSSSRLQIVDGKVYLYDLFNRPNTYGHTFTDLGPLSNVKQADGSTGFATNNDLYTYYNSSIGSGSTANATSQYTTYTEVGQTLKYRTGMRTGKIVFDKELTVTGFAGSESTDDGATGDWMMINSLT